MLTYFKKAEIECSLIGTARFAVLTEALGGAMVERFSTSLDPTVGRAVVPVAFPGSITGKLFQPVISGVTGAMVLYRMRVWAKKIGHAGDSPWQWYEVPVPPTPEDWTRVPLRIQATPDEWSRVNLRIAPTSDEWSRVEIPMPAASAVPVAIRVPVDAIE